MGEPFRSKALDWASAAAQREAQEIYGDVSALYDLPEPHPMTRTPTETMLLEALEAARVAIGDHFAPNDCYATGPRTGDPILDLVVCPACSFIAVYERARRAIATAKGEDRT